MSARWVVAVLAVAAFSPTATASARWHLTDLGTLGSPFSRATAINDVGQVAGFSTPAGGTTDDPHCFLWERGKMRDLGELPGTIDCEPVAIDDAGDVAGTSGPRAFFWHDGHFTDLGRGEVAGMNAHGWVVVVDGDRAFRWHDGVKTSLDARHGAWSSVLSPFVEENGDIVGTVFFGLRERAVVWHDGTLTLLPLLPGATEARVSGVNAGGTIVGTNEFKTGYHTKAVIWAHGTVTAIPAPNRGDGEAVSGLGEVGVLTTSGDAGVGITAASYVWSNGKLLPVNRWVDFTCANHHLLAGQRHHAFVWMNDRFSWLPAKGSAVNDCNEHDQIVGWTYVKGSKVSGARPVHAALWSH